MDTLTLCCELYNAALQERRDAWNLNRIGITFRSQSDQLPAIKQERPELSNVYSQVLQDVLHRADKALKGFFARIKRKAPPGYPRFKPLTRYTSLTYPQRGFSIADNAIHLTKLGRIKAHTHRPVLGQVKTLTVSREGSKWFAIVSCADVPANPLPLTNQVIGVDVGIESFATLSDGTHIPNWKYYESAAKKLRIAQRRVARRKKGSNRRRKAVAILRNIHQSIVNQRSDFQHKLSTHLIRHNDVIAVEKLNIAGLAKGRLSKQILDASWSSFIFMLRYKAESAGRKLIEVDPRWTSQDCSACGERVKKALSVRMHHCPSCGLSLHRDHNAALNILSRGLRDQDLTWAVAPCVS